MILARARSSQRQPFAFTGADGEGAKVFSTDFLRAVLEHGRLDAVHVFADLYGSFRRSDDQGDVNELRRAFPRCPIELKRVIDLPALASRHEYLFAISGVDLQPLAQTRLAAGVRFPINSTLSALDSPFMLPVHLAAILLGTSCDAFVVPSRAGLETVQRLTAGACELLRIRLGGRVDALFRSVVIPHGVDDGLFGDIDRTAARRLIGVPAEARVALYLGRLNDQVKADLEPLLVAFQRCLTTVPQALLLIAGHDIDQYSGVVARRAEELSIRDKLVFVLDFPHFVKPSLYAAADVFVSPVDNIQETFGISIVEAMAAGRPVIASDWSGYTELVVEGETGLLVPTLWDSSRAVAVSKVSAILNPRIRRQLLAETTVVDVNVLAAHLGTLLGDATRCRSMGDAGRKRALEHWSWRTVIRAYEQLWGEQLEEARRAPVLQPVSLHDMNGLFRHYASHSVSSDTAVTVSDRGRDLLERSRGAASGTVGSLGLDAFCRFAQRCDGQPILLPAACTASGSSASQIVSWVKKGYLDLV